MILVLSSDFKTYSLFNNIVGYDNIKKIFYFAIRSHLPVHILLVGPPGFCKNVIFNGVYESSTFVFYIR